MIEYVSAKGFLLKRIKIVEEKQQKNYFDREIKQKK